MKIIYKGIKPPEPVYQGSCNKCGTVVEFEKSEGDYLPRGYIDYSIAIKCPVCNFHIYGEEIKNEPTSTN